RPFDCGQETPSRNQAARRCVVRAGARGIAMASVTEWARDLLASRGALVEGDEGDSLRALLPQEVASTLAIGDWLSLNFGTSAGADDPVDWMERLASNLPSRG